MSSLLKIVKIALPLCPEVSTAKKSGYHEQKREESLGNRNKRKLLAQLMRGKLFAPQKEGSCEHYKREVSSSE